MTCSGRTPTNQELVDNARMSTAPDAPAELMAQRLTELEIKASYTEDLLEELNLTIYKQQQQIDTLTRKLVELDRRMPEASGSPRNLRDELPPHY